MIGWNDYKITVVDPMRDIERFVNEHECVSGAINVSTGEIVDGWPQAPHAKLGLSCYCVERCAVGLCDVEIVIEFPGRAIDDAVDVYRCWTAAYPTLRIIWRYYLGDNGVGYIDEAGDHFFHDSWEAEPVGDSGCLPANEPLDDEKGLRGLEIEGNDENYCTDSLGVVCRETGEPRREQTIGVVPC
jgi:hypothetical protein